MHGPHLRGGHCAPPYRALSVVRPARAGPAVGRVRLGRARRWGASARRGPGRIIDAFHPLEPTSGM